MLKMTHNFIPNLVKRFKELDKSKLEVGYFPENGMHEKSQMGYANLFGIQSFGSRKRNIPARPVLDLEFSTFNPLSHNTLLKTQLKLFFSNIKSTTPKVKMSVILKKVSGSYVESTRGSFGDLSKLAANAKSTQAKKARAGVLPNNPLIWDGKLRDNLSYSINGQTVVTP